MSRKANGILVAAVGRLARLCAGLLLVAPVVFPIPVRSAGPAISAGGGHSLAVNVDGSGRGWGDDTSGQVGAGRTLFSANPSRIAGISRVTSIAAGFAHALARTDDGSVWSWGFNVYGQLGDGSTANRSSPVQVRGLSDVVAVSAGLYHSAAVKSDGTIWTWGRNADGQLGDGTTTDRSSPVVVTGLTGVIAISVGSYHTAAATSDGSVWTWGNNHSGQLGDGTTLSRASPVKVNGLSGVIAVSAGSDDVSTGTFALKSDGTVWAWGNNYAGRLGDGTTIDRSTPVRVMNLSNVIAIATSQGLTVALRADHTVWTWGFYDQGGLDPITGQDLPKPVPGLSGAIAISAGGSRDAAALKDDGTVWAWQAFSGIIFVTRHVVGLPAVTAVAVGQTFTLAADSGGGVWAWGDNSEGQLGDGAPSFRSTPTRVSTIANISSIAAGSAHSVALKSDGTVWSWGENFLGQLTGRSNVNDRSTPAPMIGLSGISAISAGLAHSLALTSGGAVVAWGGNALGLVIGEDASSSPVPPVQLRTLADMIAVSAGGLHSAALKRDGTVWTWGLNSDGQLGDGSSPGRSTPAVVGGIAGIVAISAGDTHTVALGADGTVWAWGRNLDGELGDGTTVSRHAPVQVVGLSGVTAISAGRSHTVALGSDGSVWSWGDNSSGQLGDGTIARRPIPARVPGLSGVVAVSAGASHTLALKGDGTVWAWGGSAHAQLGDGTFTTRPRPVIALRENGSGSLQSNDWFLDLNPAIPKVIPADKTPALLAVSSGSVTGSVVSITADVQFRAKDLGNPIRIFAYAPVGVVKSATPASKDGPTCVLAQLTSNGLQQASASSLQPYVSNVTSTQQQAVTVLNNVSASQVAGATFCVGTAATSAQSVDPANSVCAATVPDPTNPVCTAPDASSAANASFEGLWLKWDESGWGVNVTHQGTTLFATWFTYDTDGTGMWLVASSLTQTSPGNFSGALYRTVGPAFSANPFNSIGFPANYTTVGTLSFSFTDANNGTMSYTVNGVSQSKAITRYIYASGGTNCTLGGTQGSSPNYQDLWLRSASGATEAGWGINITHQGDILFATWFTYLAGSGSTNKGMWLVMSNGNKVSNGVYTGVLQTTTGPAFSAVPFNPNSVARTTVGSGTFTFTDANNGTFNYTVNGVTQSKPIARYVYASPVTLCQ